MDRKAVFAGKFYPDDLSRLDKEMQVSFLGKKGPGELPGKRRDRKVFGVIVPHAGYTYSGPCAAWAYKEIGESKFPETFIIIGVNHSGIGPDIATYTFSDWESVLGKVRVDKKLGSELMEKCNLVANNVNAHASEHSIEVQLPFLQYANRDKLKDLKFLPISVSCKDYDKLVKVGKAIGSLSKDVCVIVSSDFIHYGESYGFVPFKHAVKDNIYRMDSQSIDFIKKFDSKGFFNFSKKSTICGANAIVIGMEACKSFGAKKVGLLNYYTSGDLTGYDHAVGYGALEFT